MPIQRSELVDPDAVLTGAPAEPPCCDAIGECPFAKASSGGPASTIAARPFFLRFPINGKVTVEVRASMTRVPHNLNNDSPPLADRPLPAKD